LSTADRFALLNVSACVGSCRQLECFVQRGESGEEDAEIQFPPSLMHNFYFILFFCIGRPRAVPYREGRNELEQIMNDSIELLYEVRVVNIFPWEKHGQVIPTSTHPLSVL